MKWITRFFCWLSGHDDRLHVHPDGSIWVTCDHCRRGSRGILTANSWTTTLVWTRAERRKAARLGFIEGPTASLELFDVEPERRQMIDPDVQDLITQHQLRRAMRDLVQGRLKQN